METVDLYSLWDSIIDPQAAAAANYDLGLTPAQITDFRTQQDLLVAKQEATTNGNTKLVNTLDFILKYGDKALSILSKNGIIKNQNLVAAYPTYSGLLTDTSTITNNAPATTGRVFNIDFTDPKVLIITFLLLMILFYFLFFNPSSRNGKR